MITADVLPGGQVRVMFKDQDLVQTAMAGLLRRANAITRNIPAAHGFQGAGWDIDIEGALAEAAVAKALGVFWSVGVFRGADVAVYQVRMTAHANGRLIVNPRDEDHVPFILVTGEAGTYVVRGWCYAKDGKVEQYWANPSGRKDGGAFFVPQRVLHALRVLPAADQVGPQRVRTMDMRQQA